jgi:hypothetical protein
LKEVVFAREDLVAFLNSITKSEETDPLRKLIGTCNNQLVILSSASGYVIPIYL